MRSAAVYLSALVLATGVACNEVDGDAKTEPVLLPEEMAADVGADAGGDGSNTQVIYEGFISEPNPVPSDPPESTDRFFRDLDSESDSTGP